jgi:hypothetical protein
MVEFTVIRPCYVHGPLHRPGSVVAVDLPHVALDLLLSGRAAPVDAFGEALARRATASAVADAGRGANWARDGVRAS